MVSNFLLLPSHPFGACKPFSHSLKEETGLLLAVVPEWCPFGAQPSAPCAWGPEKIPVSPRHEHAMGHDPYGTKGRAEEKSGTCRAQSLLCLPESSGGCIHSLAFLSSADDEAMATEVAPPASAELTELGKCLTQQEVRAPALTATTLSL